VTDGASSTGHAMSPATIFIGKQWRTSAREVFVENRSLIMSSFYSVAPASFQHDPSGVMNTCAYVALLRIVPSNALKYCYDF
jgi:hypothetical protein